jgi:hypothetical protein
MGDPRRFDLFAEQISNLIPPDFAVADVAAGKGFLQGALRSRGFTNVTSWDRRPKTIYNALGHRYDYFSHNCEQKYQAVVGMHPDEGTDHALLYAAKHRCVAILCPCCIKPSATAFWGKHRYPIWINHLISLGEKYNMTCDISRLKMNGRSDVLFFRPYK